MGDPLSLTEYPRSTPPSLPSTAGTIFTDPDFGSNMVRVTVDSDCQQAELTISTTGVWNYDGTIIGPVLCYNYPMTANEWNIFTFDPSTMAVSGKKQLNNTGMNFGFQYVMWDWSGLRNNYLCGVLATANDADRNLVTFDTSGTINVAAISTIKAFLSSVQRSGTVATSASTTSFTGNHTDPEVMNDQWVGMTITMDSGNCSGQTKAISAYTAASKTFTTAAFSLTPSVGSAYHLNYLGINHNFEVSPDGRYFVWAACEGATARGGAGAGQDAGRTMFWYDRTNNLLKVHYITGAETGQDTPANGGIHSLELFKDGQNVLFSGMGTITGNANPAFLWNPLGTNPSSTTGDGTITVYSKGAHRDLSTDRWLQLNWDSGTADRLDLRLLSSPTVATPALRLPTKSGQTLWAASSGYISWTADTPNCALMAIPMSYATTGWTLVSGAKYKSTTYAGTAGLSAAQNPEGRHNGQAMTFMGTVAGAADSLLTAAGQYAWDSTNSAVYVWGFNDADLVNKTSDVTGAAVANVGNTTSTFKTNLASAVNDYYKGQIVKFDNLLAYTRRRITAYDGTTKFVTVDAVLPAIPAGGEGVTVLGHCMHLWDWRVGAEEIFQVWLDDIATNTTKIRRICHMHSFHNGGSGDTPNFEQFPKLSASRDNRYVAFVSNWAGGTRADIIVAQMATSNPTTRYLPFRWP